MSLYRQAGTTGVWWFAVICCWLAPSAAVLAAPPPATVTTVVAEPVFRGKAHVFTTGREDAPTVVLVHGLGERGARDWDSLTAVLARDFRVVSFDLPGFGHSSKDNELYSPEKYATFLRYLMAEHFRIPKFSLVGHSMGGAIALRYAARFPQDVSALVLADVPGILHPMAYSRFLSQLGINFLPNLYPAQHDHLRNLVSSVLRLADKVQPMPEVILATPKLRQSMLNADPNKIAGLALALEDFSADLPRVQAPVLVLWGGRDTIAPLRNGRVLSANLPRARLEVFSASGHTPMEDVPEPFNARIAGFLHAPSLVAHDRLLQRELLQPVSSRVGTCTSKRDVVFEGDYDRITIHRCRGTVVRNARVRKLEISNAVVTIEDSLIGGVDGGLQVEAARVAITSSRIEGRVAITANDAHLDIAGSQVVGTEAALAAPRKSEVLFSVSRVRSPHFYGNLHEMRIVTPDNPL